MEIKTALAPYTIPYLKHYKNGNTKLVKVKTIKWFSKPHRTVIVQRQGEHQPIEYTPFNPGSRDHIRKWMADDYNYTFPYYTPKGNAKVDVDSLENMTNPAGKKLKRYLKVSKDQSQIGGADGSLILNYNSKTHGIHSRIDTNGTNTGRFTSSSPNLAQIPSQPEFRELFDAPEGWSFIGTDFDGAENVVLSELLYTYDNGALDKIITTGDKDKGTDLHSLNGKACGVNRQDGKAIWFGKLYGSSPTLTGYTILGDKPYTDYTESEFTKMKAKLSKRIVKLPNDTTSYYPVKKDLLIIFSDKLVIQAIFGEHIQKKLTENTKGLDQLEKDLHKQYKQCECVVTKGERNLHVNSPHKMLNYSCQGANAEAIKYYLIEIHKQFDQAGLTQGVHYIQQAVIYDEVDMIVRDDKVEIVKNILLESYTAISRQLGMKVTFTGEVLIGKNWQECH